MRHGRELILYSNFVFLTSSFIAAILQSDEEIASDSDEE